MNFHSVVLILLSVSLSVLAQILLKHGMTDPNVQSAFKQSMSSGVTAVLANFSVLGGFFAFLSSATVWLGVLVQVEVSKAYPFVGLGFIGTMLFAYWFLNEPLTLTKLSGTMFIVIGVVLISR